MSTVQVHFIMCQFLVLMLLATTAADFKFERFKTPCNVSCEQGACEYTNCNSETRLDCFGGACSFTRCHNPQCMGGACVFDGCTDAMCNGGGCNFVNQEETLTEKSCMGENCRLEGQAMPVLHKGEFLTI